MLSLPAKEQFLREGNGVLSLALWELNLISFVVSEIPESFHSASHGAGRRMSRTQAKKNYTLKDLEAQTSGVECRKMEEF